MGASKSSNGEEGEFSEEESLLHPPAKKGKAGKAPEAEGDIADEQEHVDTSKMTSEDVKLEKIVALPTWREMLLDLVAAKKLDPWNIDIVEITGSYIERINKMEMLDLRVPANLILAAAILVRFKASALRFEEEAQVVVEETYVEEDASPEVIPVLELKTRIPPKRMVTLDELLLAMEKVFDEQKKREEKAQKIEIPAVINIQLPEFNIEQRMAEVYQRVVQEKDSEGLATFSGIVRDNTPVEAVATLLPLLHLVQDRKLSIFQEKFFGEIFIRVKDELQAAPKAK
jgi:segregation and condensation protein A